MAAIEFVKATKRYRDGTVAVRDLDLAIRDGEFMILVGPSGCGKTTALRMIAGLELITSGELRIDGEVVNEMPPRKRDVAMVFQSYALYPHMSVADNMGFALKVARAPKPTIREKVKDAASMLDLTEQLRRKPGNLSGGQRQRVAMGRAIIRSPKAFLMDEPLSNLDAGLRELIDRKPGALSGGQRQRVAMGRAMVRKPQAYLMDEPLSNLDAKLRVGMRAELSRLHDRLGVTTIYVTHDQVEAMTLGDRVAVLRDGTVQQCDAPERLFEAPANVFVAAFIGSPAMNLVLGELRDGRLNVAGIETPLPAARGHDGRVIAGIRPTDLRPAGADDDPDAPRLRAELEVVERLGSESHVIFPVEAEKPAGDAAAAAEQATEDSDATLLAGDNRARFTAAIPGRRRFTHGEVVELLVPPDALHLFDPATGVALS